MSAPGVDDLIPHGEAIRLIDALTDWAPGEATCLARVTAERPFVDRDEHGQLGMDAVVTLEHMAQTVAACLGYEAFQGGSGVRVGMIVGLRQMTLATDRVPLGAELSVRVRRLRGNEEISTFEGETRLGALDGPLVATALMTLVHAEKPPE